MNKESGNLLLFNKSRPITEAIRIGTDEDKIRGDLYKSESKRTNLKQQLKSLSDWIKTLDLTITIENIKNENIPRAVQLLNKTNQMNLSTRRLNEQEFNKWIQEDKNNLWTIRATDKFGDYGIIGIFSISIKDSTAILVDFILSCRVVGRYIEETMVEFLNDLPHGHGVYVLANGNVYSGNWENGSLISQ